MFTDILCDAGTSLATVTSVHDGDTITLLCNARHIRIRLDSVDAPEMQQVFGGAARQFTSDLALGKTVTFDERDVDRLWPHRGLCSHYQAAAA